jgi:hypothetical protein
VNGGTGAHRLTTPRAVIVWPCEVVISLTMSLPTVSRVIGSLTVNRSAVLLAIL